MRSEVACLYDELRSDRAGVLLPPAAVACPWSAAPWSTSATRCG